MRVLLTGIAFVLAATAVSAAAPAQKAPPQRAPATFLPPSVSGSEIFLEGWFAAEYRSAGLEPLWPNHAVRGYRARYRLLSAGDGSGATIVTIDVDEDGSGLVTSTRLRPGKMVEKEGRAKYIAGRVMWEDSVHITSAQSSKFRRQLDTEGFSRRGFRSAVPVDDGACATGGSYLIEAHDRRRGYNAIVRDDCDVQDARNLIDSMMRFSGRKLTR